MTARLFGSRAKGEGVARQDSDFDVLICEPRLAQLVPRPFYSEVPQLLEGEPLQFFEAAHRWSQLCLQAIGGQPALRELKNEAKSQLGIVGDDAKIDMFLYLPPKFGNQIWAVHLDFSFHGAISFYWEWMVQIAGPLCFHPTFVSAVEQIAAMTKSELLGPKHLNQVEAVRTLISYPPLSFAEMSYFELLERGDKYHRERSEQTDYY